jgi:hypothetical protein
MKEGLWKKFARIFFDPRIASMKEGFQKFGTRTRLPRAPRQKGDLRQKPKTRHRSIGGPNVSRKAPNHFSQSADNCIARL